MGSIMSEIDPAVGRKWRERQWWGQEREEGSGGLEISRSKEVAGPKGNLQH